MRTPNRIRTTLGVLAVAAFCSVVTARTEYTVIQIERTFDPVNLTVAPGDTVRWVHTGGGHTVTSGSNCTYDGLYFDEPLTTQNPLVVWIVPGDLEGALDYFCDPHCGNDMVGVITVVGAGCPADVDGSGAVDFADLLDILGSWGPCEGECPADIDNSGDVGFGDILLVLGNWGPCP